MSLKIIRKQNKRYMSTYGTGTYGHPGGIQPSDINAIAAAVWDSVLANHLTAGTTGKALDDAAQGGGVTAQDKADIINGVKTELSADFTEIKKNTNLIPAAL